MAQYGASYQSMEIFTGNPRTVLDPLVANTYSAPTGAYEPPYGQLNNLGASYFDNTGKATLNGTVTFTPFGVPTKYRYVKYLSTDTTAVKGYPSPVFWVDEQMTTVSDKMSEGYTTTQQSIAGWLMVNSTDLTTLTITILNNSGNGSGVLIAVAGFVSAAGAAAAGAGDWLIGGATAWTPVVVASGTSTGYRQAAYALTAASSNQADIFVTVESL